MKRLIDLFLRVGGACVAIGAGAMGLALMTASTASAQAAYGSYIGVGPSVGLTQGAPGEGRQISAVVAARYKLLEVPLSIRTQALLFSGTTAIVPTISYDIPLNWQTDAYIGAGYSFSNGDQPSPIGNKNAIVLQPGIDYVLPDSNIVVFGNALIAFDAYRTAGGTAVSLQGGVGLRF